MREPTIHKLYITYMNGWKNEEGKRIQERTEREWNMENGSECIEKKSAWKSRDDK